MNHYSIYGSCLATAMHFPELRPAGTAAPKWTFDTTPQLPSMNAPAELGAELIYADVHARLYRHADGHRIVVDDTGEFDLSLDGRRLRWQERHDAWPDFVRAHLMGRVLATSLFLDGGLPLHGSAVAIGSGVIAFLAPKGYGKSSTALALTSVGGRLVTDDTLPVEPAVVPIAWPGVHSMRVRADSMDAQGLANRGFETHEGKRVLADIPEDRLQHSPAPLRAIYLLNPFTRKPGDAPAARTPMAESMAALWMVSHVKIARMLGASAAPALLDRAATVVRAVPVYRLDAARELELLPTIAETIASWHRAA